MPNTAGTAVILPSETQSREFDAKLLLACALAERGRQVFVGSRIAIHAAMHRFPRSIYVAKDFRKPSNRIFRIMHDLGHHIVAWDEEAVLFYNAREFHERRVHEPTFRMVEELFAWGPQNGEFLRSAPGYDEGVPVHLLGNPRIDMLRPELRRYYDEDVASLHRRHGRMILINTNFGKLNHAVSKYVVRPGGKDLSVGGTITPFMQQAWEHRLRIFESMKALVPFLAQNFRDHTIIVRPHPAENHETWKQAAAGHDNVRVIHDGPVQTWLLAADAMIHNGCTTGIEAYLLDAPTISFQPFDGRQFDFNLSNDLGIKAVTPDDVAVTIRRIGQLKTASTPEEKIATLGHYFSGLAGPLASDGMAAVIDRRAALYDGEQKPALQRRASAQIHSRMRALHKRLASHIPDHKNSRAYNEQRFAGITAEQVNDRIGRLRDMLGRFDKIKAAHYGDNICVVSSLGSSLPSPFIKKNQ